MGKKKVVAKSPSPAEVEKAQVLAEKVREQRRALAAEVLAGGIFLVGIIVAVPAARPFVIKIIERLPGVKDLPDDG